MNPLDATPEFVKKIHALVDAALWPNVTTVGSAAELVHVLDEVNKVVGGIVVTHYLLRRPDLNEATAAAVGRRIGAGVLNLLQQGPQDGPSAS